MEKYNFSKNLLLDLNKKFLSTIDEDNLYNKKKFLNTIESNNEVNENEKKYINDFDNLDNKNKEKNKDLKLVTTIDHTKKIIHPNYLREHNNENNNYINFSFVDDLIKIPNDKINITQNIQNKKYNLNYNNSNNKKYYEYINSTNEYYITKNVEEKIPNTGITEEDFYFDKNILTYEDSIKKWSDKSKYLYFLDCQKENSLKKKKTKLKKVQFKDDLVDKYEKAAHTINGMGNQNKIENLILQVLNNDLDESELDELLTNENKLQEYNINEQLNENKQKKVDLDIKKKEIKKDNRHYILDYLHYDNFFYEQNVNNIISSSSESEKEVNDQYKEIKDYSENESKIKEDINNILHQVKNDLDINKFNKFIQNKLSADIFQCNNYCKSDNRFFKKNINVLKKIKIHTNEQKMKEEFKLLERYNYEDHLYSPGYFVKNVQQLKRRPNDKINIYDLKKKKMFEKFKEDLIEEEVIKKEEEKLIKQRLENKRIYSKFKDILDVENIQLKKNEINFDIKDQISQIDLNFNKIEDHVYDDDDDEITVKDDLVKEEESLKEEESVKEEESEDDDDYDEEESEDEDEINEIIEINYKYIDEYIDTDSAVSFENINEKNVNQLKKKYRVLKKSENAEYDDIKKLKFHLCEKLNKTKHKLNKMKNKIILEKKKKKKKIERLTQVSKAQGFNLLAQIIDDDVQDTNYEEDDEEESDLFDDMNNNVSEEDSGEYTYSSITISSHEYINYKTMYNNNNVNDKIFYINDVYVNMIYSYGFITFFIYKNNIKEKIGKLFIEIYINEIKLYKAKENVENEDLTYILIIDEKTKIKFERTDNNNNCEITLDINSDKGKLMKCSLIGYYIQINYFYNYINGRILLMKYINYLKSIPKPINEQSVFYFLTEEKVLILKNVSYEEKADEIICEYKNMDILQLIDFSNRKMNIYELLVFFKLSSINICSSLNLQGNPLFDDMTLFECQTSIDEIISFFKNIKLNYLILDFVNLSNDAAEYFLEKLMLNTNINFLSLNNCNLKDRNIINIYDKLSSENVMHINLQYLSVEFNNLNYFHIIRLISIMKKLNGNFEKLYIYGNNVQSNIFDVSFKLRKYESIIQKEKYYKQYPNVYNLQNTDHIKTYFTCSMRGFAQCYENDEIINIFYEIYGPYLYVLKPTLKIYNIKQIEKVKKGEFIYLILNAFIVNKGKKLEIKLFKNEITIQFYNIVKKSLLGKIYFNKQKKRNKEINENILNYFNRVSENELNFYYYNINKEELNLVFNICKNTNIKYINLGNCYINNECIKYLNSKNSSNYSIRVYKLNLSKNYLTKKTSINGLIKFLSNFKIYFKINLNDLKIGKCKNIHRLFIYLLNSTKCKIITFNNCNLGNKFLKKINTRFNEFEENEYIKTILLEDNLFSNVQRLIKFLNGLTSKFNSINKINISSKYLNSDDYEEIKKKLKNPKIIFFTKLTEKTSSSNIIKKDVNKLQKSKLDKTHDYDYTNITLKEKHIIDNFILKNAQKSYIKKDIENRYDLNNIKNRKIKYINK